MTDCFYDELAESYHLIFDDWGAAIRRQREVLARLLPAPPEGKRLLDCACGIGTQAIGLATLGFVVDGSDLSAAAIERARREATALGMNLEFRIDDMRCLSTAPIHALRCCHSDGQRGTSPSERRRHQDGFRSNAPAVAERRHSSHKHARLRLVDCPAHAVDAPRLLSGRPVPPYRPSSVGLARRPSPCPASVHNDGEAGRLAHPALCRTLPGRLGERSCRASDRRWL